MGLSAFNRMRAVRMAQEMAAKKEAKVEPLKETQVSQEAQALKATQEAKAEDAKPAQPTSEKPEERKEAAKKSDAEKLKKKA